VPTGPGFATSASPFGLAWLGPEQPDHTDAAGVSPVERGFFSARGAVPGGPAQARTDLLDVLFAELESWSPGLGA
jgi:hypothetical protein